MKAESLDVVVRRASLADVEKIYALIHLHAEFLMLRSVGNIVENIDRFYVACVKDEIVGCASYQIHPELGQPESAMTEIQSGAVRAPYRRCGVGKALIERIMREVAVTGVHEVFVLTFAPEFFSSLGFHVIPKTQVIHKIYTGCINCTRHKDPFTCPEIAMSRTCTQAEKENA